MFEILINKRNPTRSKNTKRVEKWNNFANAGLEKKKLCYFFRIFTDIFIMFICYIHLFTIFTSLHLFLELL